MQITGFLIDFSTLTVGFCGADERFTIAGSTVETADGTQASAVVGGRATTSGSRHLDEVRPENIRLNEGGEDTKADIAAALNAMLDDTDPHRQEHELSYAAAEALGETDTDAKSARERLKAGKPVRLRMTATNGQGDVREVESEVYEERAIARSAAIRTAKKTMSRGASEDWRGWRMEARTNGDNVLFSVTFDKARSA